MSRSSQAPSDTREPTLAEIRRRAGLSQAELGLRTGHSQSVVSRWERGLLEPTVQDLLLLAPVLHASLDRLVIAVDGPGRRCSRRGDSVAGRRQVARALRDARNAAGLDTWTLGRTTGITPRRLRRLESSAEPSIAEMKALIESVPGLVEALRSAGLDTPADPHRVRSGPNPTRESAPE